MREFSGRVLDWFDRHGRKDLPWQRDIDAYRVWVSEIMLQQTQVATVVPYYERFMRSFPDVAALANASRDDVLQHWSGLGYYARARNLHKAAVVVRDEHGGEFPREFDEVVALPGIGRSTAGAILAIAFGARYPILDGNVKRVLTRHRCIAGWPGKASVAKSLWAVAEELTPAERVGDYTQAIMDLGATVCLRGTPTCERCPVAIDCRARVDGVVSDYPGRKARTSKPLRETTMLLVLCGDTVLMQRRPEAGIWGGLWSLPELGEETPAEWVATNLGGQAGRAERWPVLRHSFTHFELDIRPVVLRVEPAAGRVADSEDTRWCDLTGDPPGGVAAPVKRLMEELKKYVR